MDTYEEWLTALLIKYGTYKPLTIIIGSDFEHGRRYGHIVYKFNHADVGEHLGWVITDAAVKYLKRKQREHIL